MQEKHLFEYAVIRVVPCVEREEFVNAGVVVYCASQRFLGTLFKLNVPRLQAFCPEVDIGVLDERLRAFEQICRGTNEGGPIAKLPIASRFRWVTATRSTVVQVSPVHPGLCANAGETLQQLFVKLVP